MSVTDTDDGLLAAALGAGLTYERAAEVAGVSRATAGRRMADPSFRAQVERLRRDHARRIEVRLADNSTRAVAALDDLIADRDSPRSVSGPPGPCSTACSVSARSRRLRIAWPPSRSASPAAERR